MDDQGANRKDGGMLKTIESVRSRTAGFIWGVLIGLSFVVMAPVWIAQSIRAWRKINK
jgi:hypothetical protein